ncbi:hypothetical protein PCANB_000729 [Pneumocystis canis]|nr:hypothetical protein PCK1_000639 [Pneumocystis canis]KAG5437692.1 hypothetical protein PCANB_000729 [Pneumocystis canis]
MSNKKYKNFKTITKKESFKNTINKFKIKDNQSILLSIAVFASAIIFLQSPWADILVPQL